MFDSHLERISVMGDVFRRCRQTKELDAGASLPKEFILTAFRDDAEINIQTNNETKTKHGNMQTSPQSPQSPQSEPLQSDPLQSPQTLSSTPSEEVAEEEVFGGDHKEESDDEEVNEEEMNEIEVNEEEVEEAIMNNSKLTDDLNEFREQLGITP